LKRVPNLTSNHIALLKWIRNRTQDNHFIRELLFARVYTKCGIDVDNSSVRV